MAKLRFAPICRVSTTQQAKKGESLPVQKKKITQYVKQLDGVLIDDPWRYSGSEHAAVGFQRERFEQLLNDAKKDIYDAVIVTHPDRWSRDNAKSKAGLQILRDNNKKFYIGSEKIDLFDEGDRLKIGIFTEFAEYQALVQVRKSIESKIARAKQNIPTVTLPFGRTFDRSKSGKEGWGIDSDKKAKIEHAAERYLQGVPLDRICKEVSIKRTSLWKILKKRSGTEWEVSFQPERLNINETITYDIPALLPDETIKAIHLQAKANKNYNCKQRKNRYLLSGMIHCQKCGQLLTGTCSNGYRYYRHPRNDCRNFYNIRADEIETEVFWHIYWMIGNKTGFEKAVNAAIPDTKGIENANKRLSQIAFDLKRVSNEKGRILKAIRKGLVDLDDPTLKKDLDKLKSRETALTDEKSSLLSKLENQPSQEEIDSRFRGWQRILKSNYELNEEHLLKMSFDDRRALLQALFSGEDESNQRFGVYVTRDRRFTRHPFLYEIRGNLPAINEKSRIGYDPIGNYGTDEEGKSLVNTYNTLFAQLTQSLWVTHT